MKTIAAPLVGLCALLLAGCASTIQYPPFPDQTKTIEDPAKARIYVMRPAQAWNAHSIIRLSATGPKMPGYGSITGELGPGRYLCWEEPPGPFRIRRGPDDDVRLELVAGHVYYLRASAGVDGMYSNPSFKVLNEEAGLSLLKRCKPPDSYARTAKQ